MTRKHIDDLTPKAELDSDHRELYPIGDQHGQVVQTVTPFPVEQNVPNWTQEEPLTVSSTVIQLNKAMRLSNNYCLITVQAANIRYWIGGRVPTTSEGHELFDGDTLILESADELNDIQFIRQSGTDAILACSFGNRS